MEQEHESKQYIERPKARPLQGAVPEHPKRRYNSDMPTLHEQSIKAGLLKPSMNFNEKVWALTARIPKGKVTTYAAIARKLNTKAYRAVGNAMNRNPFAPTVPCHRVVGSDGKLTGYAHGLPKKAAMLRAEGVEVEGERVALEAYSARL